MLKKFQKKPEMSMIMYFILIFFYGLPIITLSRPYIDDLGRTLYGYAGWSLNGRPLSDIIMEGLNLGGDLLDLSPLPQMLGLLILGLFIYLFCEKYFNIQSKVTIIFTAFIFVANPFYIENLSYKYDALPMALSQVALIIPFLINTKRNSFNFAIHILSIISSLSLYQASIGIYPILTIIRSLYSKESGRENREFSISLCFSIISIITAYILYKVTIASHFVVGEYNTIHAKTIDFDKNGAVHLVDNLKSIFGYIKSYLISMPVILILVYSIIIISSIIKETVTNYKKLKTKGSISTLILLTSPLVILILSILPIAILENPVLSPRVFISFSAVTMFYSYLLIRELKSEIFKIILIIPLIWISMVYSYSYSNSSESQSELEKLIATSIYNDVNHQSSSFNYVNIKGIMPKSAQLQLAEKKLPLMSALVPIYLNYDWLWGAELLNHYGLNLKYKTIPSQKQEEIYKSIPFSTTQHYDLYKENDTLIVLFK